MVYHRRDGFFMCAPASISAAATARNMSVTSWHGLNGGHFVHPTRQEGHNNGAHVLFVQAGLDSRCHPRRTTCCVPANIATHTPRTYTPATARTDSLPPMPFFTNRRMHRRLCLCLRLSFVPSDVDAPIAHLLCSAPLSWFDRTQAAPSPLPLPNTSRFPPSMFPRSSSSSWTGVRPHTSLQGVSRFYLMRRRHGLEDTDRER
ncbi:hypothetical protein C8R45DRAFT_965719 [Mycena sanguinolenta]|nr:hypothetical protein C8R45DRAFT_965719 [Mycena sanguinolenta]